MKNNYGGKCIGQKNHTIQIKRNMKLNIHLKWVIELEQLFFIDLFNVNMTLDGQEKFLKFLEDL